jgi:integrase
MPRRSKEIYRRGRYWLDWDCRSDGIRRSPYLTIFWYDPEAGRVRSSSTGTDVEAEGIKQLDLKYLADTGEAVAFCPTCGQKLHRSEAYLLVDAIADYKVERGDKRASAVTIRSRLNHVVDFLEATGRAQISCEDATTLLFAEQYRAWAAEQPVRWRNKDGVVTVEKPRTPAAIEECVSQVRAVLNHAVDMRRAELRPMFKTIGRRQVSSPRRVRCDVPVLADMVAYAAEPKLKRSALHAFLIGSLTTIARPDAVLEISVDPKRRQWWPGSQTIDLNPANRRQTKKYRPTLPVLPLLETWLRSVSTEGGWLVAHNGKPVTSIGKAWTSMLVALKLPVDREWMPYLLRHSIATLVRDKRPDPWELSGYMGHRLPGQTETYAVGSLYPTVTSALQDLLDQIEARQPGALQRPANDDSFPK